LCKETLCSVGYCTISKWACCV